MLYFNASYKGQSEQFVQDNARPGHDAAILLFSYKSGWPVSTNSGDDFIDRRMKSPLHYHESNALCDMIRYRANQLKQNIWVTTQTFLVTMGVEEMDDLCRCDFVRAVEYLVNLDTPAQTQNAM